MQKRIGQRRLMPEIRGLAQQVFQRMSGRQHLERGNEVPDPLIGGLDAEPSAELLQHIDAGPPVRRIDHEMHRSVRLEHAAQSSEPRVRVRKMMQHPGADDLIEARPQLAYALDRKLADLEIVQVVFSLEFLGAAHARGAEVDTHHLGLGPAHGMLGRLRGPATGNQNRVIFPIGSGRPEQMIISVTPLLILPELSIPIEAVDWPGIRIAFVEVPDFRSHIWR